MATPHSITLSPNHHSNSMEEPIESSSAVQRSPIGRSNSSRFLLDDNISPEAAELTKYERLSDYVQPAEPEQQQEHKPKVWKIISAFTKGSESPKSETSEGKGKEELVVEGSAEVETKKKKKKSSWLPDPERRWPVQGWS